jgi:hypothetical protein
LLATDTNIFISSPKQDDSSEGVTFDGSEFTIDVFASVVSFQRVIRAAGTHVSVDSSRKEDDERKTRLAATYDPMVF